MADSDNTLKLLIEMGVVGQEDVKAANELLGETGKSAGEGAEGLGKFQIAGGGTRLIAAELNRIIPGLGIAFRGLTTALGPFAIIALSIQAAITYWKLYNDAVTEAAAAHGKALDQIRSAYKDAREEVENFDTAMKEASRPKNEASDMLHNAQAVLDAQMKGRKELLKLDEENEMAKAGTPEEKSAIKKKYAGRETGLDAEGEQGKIDNINSIIDFLRGQKEGFLVEQAHLEEQKMAVAKDTSRAAELKVINEKLVAVGKEAVAKQAEITKYVIESGAAQNVAGINADTRVKASERSLAPGIADRAAGGSKISSDEAQFLMRAANMATGHTNTLAQAVGLFEKNSQANGVFLARLMAAAEQQRKDMETLMAQVANGRNAPGG
jgi:hypothetical protein